MTKLLLYGHTGSRSFYIGESYRPEDLDILKQKQKHNEFHNYIIKDAKGRVIAKIKSNEKAKEILAWSNTI